MPWLTPEEFESVILNYLSDELAFRQRLVERGVISSYSPETDVHHRKTTEEVAHAIGCSTSTARRYLRKLKAANVIQHHRIVRGQFQRNYWYTLI